MLWQTNGFLILAVVIAAWLGAAEIGYRSGRRQLGREDAGGRHINSLQGGLLGLLALLLGFTISMSVSRFDTRRSLVLEEANAIGTTWLRAQFLSEGAARESAQLLRDYVVQRLEFFTEDINAERQVAASEETARIQARLWQIAVAEGREHPDADVIALYIGSLNQVIDLSEKRLGALNNHVPDTILYVMFFVAVGGMAFIGYGAGLSGRRRSGSSMIFAVLVALVLGTILDMDRPRRGFIQVSQGAMLRLQQALAVPATPP